MKVLIGVDGSTGSMTAVRQAGALLSAEHDEITLYYSPPEVRVRDPGPAAAEIRQRAVRALADGVFSEATAQLPAELQSRVSTIVGEKPPRQGLLLAAEEERVDLIVLGAHGSGPLTKVLMGGVARSVVQHAHVPVLLVRENPNRPAEQPLRVLVASDGTSACQYSRRMIERFTWPAGTTGYVIGVVESILSGNVPEWLEKQARLADDEAMAQVWVKEHEAELERKRAELTNFAAQLPASWQRVAPLVVEGYPAAQILQTIHHEGIDLVVLAAHCKGAMERFLLGSTSEKVISHAPCSVLIVRELPHP